jgi:Protein of unknown function (DUF2938)
LKLTSTSILTVIELIVKIQGASMTSAAMLMQAALVGVGATACMDLWLLLLRRAGLPTLDFALLGRWVGHLGRGRFSHAAIRLAAPVPGERLLGWGCHYAVGITFSLLLLALVGPAWLARPSAAPALAWGLATVAAPLFVLQPAMGAGIASRRTPAPLANLLRSLANHAVFGLGLFFSAAVLAPLAPAVH